MKHLHLYNTVEIDELAWPKDSAACTLATPATEFISDFQLVRPMVVDSTTTADVLKSFMLQAHIQMVSVLDSHSHFIGLVSLNELNDQSLIRKQSEGFRRSDIKVTDVMVKRKDLPAFDTEEIQDATIGDVIGTLKESGCRYSLVLDRHSHRIRAIFSVDELSARLKQPIEVRDQSSFYRFFAPVSFTSQRRSSAR